MRIEVDWTKYDLAGSQAYVANRLRENHPELMQEAAEWFGRYFSFQTHSERTTFCSTHYGNEAAHALALNRNDVYSHDPHAANPGR
jgi:hypothetical protein